MERPSRGSGHRMTCVISTGIWFGMLVECWAFDKVGKIGRGTGLSKFIFWKSQIIMSGVADENLFVLNWDLHCNTICSLQVMAVLSSYPKQRGSHRFIHC